MRRVIFSKECREIDLTKLGGAERKKWLHIDQWRSRENFGNEEKIAVIESCSVGCSKEMIAVEGAIEEKDAMTGKWKEKSRKRGEKKNYG